MNIQEIFKNQIEKGFTELFYAVEKQEPLSVNVLSHKGTLDTFPELIYIRHLSNGIPLFKEQE